jgi:hypothetical protein
MLERSPVMTLGDLNELWGKLLAYNPRISTMVGVTVVELRIPGERLVRRVAAPTLTAALLAAEAELPPA